jgi:hypothetical protein
MRPRVKPPPLVESSSDFDTRISAACQLAATYHQTARTEAIQRLGYRDTALLLFMGGCATIFGVAIGQASRLSFLYAIPILGLGAANLYAQHSQVVGTLGRYLAIDLEKSVRVALGDVPTPVQWDNSDSLLNMDGNNLPVFLSALMIIVMTQTSALLVISFGKSLHAIDALGMGVGLISITLTLFVLVSMYRLRMRFIMEIRSYVDHGK